MTTAVADPARSAQAIFRASLDAMARPGKLQHLPVVHESALAALALTLCDFETPVWLDADAANDRRLTQTLRFGAAAPVVDEPGDAAFAFVANPMAMPRLDAFALGAIENPERSTTLVVAVERLGVDGGWALSGPGIAATTQLAVGPLPDDFAAQRQALQALFPRGLDVVFVRNDRIAALPRSTRMEW